MKVGSRSGSVRNRVIGVVICACIVLGRPAWGQLGPQDVLVLVNKNSPTSRYIAKLYRQYHPAIDESQVLELPNPSELSPPELTLEPLADASGPDATAASEILTREQYDMLIAGPVRDYLSDPAYPERLTQIKVIITTGGMPYRIEDTTYSGVIGPAGSNPWDVSNHTPSIDAASVESELSCLWYGDSDDYGVEPFGRQNRTVNPYQGYRHSSLAQFAREAPGSKIMQWRTVYNDLAAGPIMEGELYPPFPPPPGTANRSFNGGDIYLTCRLDGPKVQGDSAIFSVRAMLERAKRASSPDFGVNAQQAVAVFDDSPAKIYDHNRVFNLDSSVNYWIYDPCVAQPPDASTILLHDDYLEGFVAMTGESVEYGEVNFGTMDLAGGAGVMLDRRLDTRTSQSDLDDYAGSQTGRDELQGLIVLATYGVHDFAGNPSDYLLHGGPGGGALFDVLNGAVFASIESFSNLTMFSDPSTGQGKLVDFIAIGGAGGIGHAFEPLRDALVDTEFLAFNLLADAGGDGQADLTFVEAAFTAIPYLSWSETVIGDPLMQVQFGPGGAAWTQVPGDTDNDGVVNIRDARKLRNAMGGSLSSPDAAAFDRYNDLCDLDQDGVVNIRDAWILRELM